jgi:hypothetical protein
LMLCNSSMGSTNVEADTSETKELFCREVEASIS